MKNRIKYTALFMLAITGLTISMIPTAFIWIVTGKGTFLYDFSYKKAEQYCEKLNKS